jgi:hypothetical protein
MPLEKEELQERAQLVRVHEANCEIEHPTPDELNFRFATMKAIADRFGLRCLKDKVITGPATLTKPPVPCPGKK